MESKIDSYNPEQFEHKKSMTKQETIAFLKKHKIKNLENWKPHQSILYVFEEMLRGDDGPFKFLPAEKRPSIARIYDPIHLDFNNPEVEATTERVVYNLINTGEKVDLYAIDPVTEKPLLVLTEKKEKAYHVTKEGLYMSNDKLFPLSKE